MLTRKKLKWEIKRLQSEIVYLQCELDQKEQHLENSLSYRQCLKDELKLAEQKNRQLMSDNQALQETLEALLRTIKHQGLMIKSYEAQWENAKKEEKNAAIA